MERSPGGQSRPWRSRIRIRCHTIHAETHSENFRIHRPRHVARQGQLAQGGRCHRPARLPCRSGQQARRSQPRQVLSRQTRRRRPAAVLAGSPRRRGLRGAAIDESRIPDIGADEAIGVAPPESDGSGNAARSSIFAVTMVGRQPCVSNWHPNSGAGANHVAVAVFTRHPTPPAAYAALPALARKACTAATGRSHSFRSLWNGRRGHGRRDRCERRQPPLRRHGETMVVNTG